MLEADSSAITDKVAHQRFGPGVLEAALPPEPSRPQHRDPVFAAAPPETTRTDELISAARRGVTTGRDALRRLVERVR